MDAQTLDRAFQSGAFHRLLGDLSAVPADYLREVSEAKRVVEWRDVHGPVREMLRDDPAAAIQRIGVSLTPADLAALLDPAAIPTLDAALARGAAGDEIRVAARYFAYGQEI